MGGWGGGYFISFFLKCLDKNVALNSGILKERFESSQHESLLCDVRERKSTQTTEREESVYVCASVREEERETFLAPKC